MKCKELIQMRERYQQKHDEIHEQLMKGNPMFVEGRKLGVLEMIMEQSLLARLITAIDNIEVNIDEEKINPTVRR